jgi:hypothetical protein
MAFWGITSSEAWSTSSLATVVLGAVSFAIRYLQTPKFQRGFTLIEFADFRLRIITSYLHAVFPSALPFPWPKCRSRFQCLVCIPLVCLPPYTNLFLRNSELTPGCRLSGRWPWAVEDALRKYGPVVRIAPNELAFFTPQAFKGTCGKHEIKVNPPLTFCRYLLSAAQES